MGCHSHSHADKDYDVNHCDNDNDHDTIEIKMKATTMKVATATPPAKTAFIDTSEKTLNQVHSMFNAVISCHKKMVMTIIHMQTMIMIIVKTKTT